MPMWPFGRRKPVAREGTAVLSPGPTGDGPRRTRSRRSRRKRTKTALSDPSDLQRPPRPSDDTTALPEQETLRVSPHLRSAKHPPQHAIQYNFQDASHSSLPITRERGKPQRPPSLKKNDAALVRRKSSKKREHDYVRQEEIRAMSMPLPQKRRAVNSVGMLRRDSKKVKGTLNYRLERPTSNISIPLEDSIHSSMSSGSDTREFRVSALAMFSPRPTIRCSVPPQYYYGGAGSSPTSDQEKSDRRRERRTTFSRDDNEDKRSSRIDELADTLDAGALREIMDRDKRRKEKKRKADEEHLRRRLERRAEKQKAVEYDEASPSPHRDAQGAVGLGIDKNMSAPPHLEHPRPLTPMEDVRASTPPEQPSNIEIPAPASNTAENSQLPTPLESPSEDPVVSDAKAVRYSRGSVSSPTHMRGPSNISQMPALLSEVAARVVAAQAAQAVQPMQGSNGSGSLHPVISTDTTSTSKKAFNRRRSSEGRRMSAFASFFRRGKRGSQDVGRRTPSEASFSNTSRESMSRQPLPPHLVAVPTPPIPIKRPSGAVHRSGSKFREDLPEFPLSPPDSRVQSPEMKSSAIAVRRQSHPPQDIEVHSNSPHRSDSPVSPGVPATGAMSQSLASVDSEGSWLSGKPLKRRSNKSHIRSSIGSSTLKRNEEFNASYEELGIPDDEYFKRLTPGPEERHGSDDSAEALAKKASSTAMAPADTTPEYDEEAPITERRSEDDENLVQNVVGRQPTIVHRQARVKSTEGLLSCYTDAADPPSPGFPILDYSTPEQEESSVLESPASDGESASLQRAKSVDLGKHHARHLSAGSAKLLDIQKRSSVASHSKLSEQE